MCRGVIHWCSKILRCVHDYTFLFCFELFPFGLISSNDEFKVEYSSCTQSAKYYIDVINDKLLQENKPKFRNK